MYWWSWRCDITNKHNNKDYNLFIFVLSIEMSMLSGINAVFFSDVNVRCYHTFKDSYKVLKFSGWSLIF